MTSDSDHISDFGYYLQRVSTLLKKRGEYIFDTELGITLLQFSILRTLTSETNLTSQQTVAEELGIAKSAVSREIELAQRKGWLKAQRSPESRRQNVISLTPAGKKLLAQAQAAIEKAEKAGYADISTQELEIATNVLKKLHTKMIDKKAWQEYISSSSKLR